MLKIFLLTIPLVLAAQEAPQPTQSTLSSTLLQPANRSVLVIEAKARSEDILKAYEMLKKEKPTLKISAHTYSGAILANIVDITVMPHGTLLLFRLSSAQGIKNQFVSVDEVLDLFYS